MKCSSAFFVGFFVVLFWSSSIENAIVSPCDYPAIYNFGDSNSATGASPFPINPPNAPNRICDGHIIIDFIAEHLKLPYLNAYDKSPEGNFQNGANFARPGSTIRKLNEEESPSLQKQIEKFNELKSHSKNDEAKNDSLPRQENFSKSLYTFDIGQNDFDNELLSMSLDQLRPIIADLVNQLASSIRDIYQQGQGGKAFWIHNTGPLGCLPKHIFRRHNSPRDAHGCIKSHNDVAMEFNKQLKEKLIKLRSELKQAAITYVDVYGAKYQLIGEAKELGFGDPFKFCCGDNADPNRVICGLNQTQDQVCKDPSKFISWDGTHYTQAANMWVANLTLNGSLSDPPISISQSCNM